MADFPKAFDTSTTPDNAFDIHDAAGTSGQSIWASPNPDDGMDVYTFNAGSGLGVSAFAVVIIKNMGAANSSTAFSSDGVSITGQPAGVNAFSIVETLDDTLINNSQILVPHADMVASSTHSGVAISGDASTGTVAPLGYLPVNASANSDIKHNFSVSDQAYPSGEEDLTSASTALTSSGAYNTSLAYIPIYGGNSLNNKTLDVDADGTPHYCAILVKFSGVNTSIDFNPSDNIFLLIDLVSAQNIQLLLTGSQTNTGVFRVQCGEITTTSGTTNFLVDKTFDVTTEANPGALIEVDGDVVPGNVNFENVSTGGLTNRIDIPRYPRSLFAGLSGNVYDYAIRLVNPNQNSFIHLIEFNHNILIATFDNGFNVGSAKHFQAGQFGIGTGSGIQFELAQLGGDEFNVLEDGASAVEGNEAFVAIPIKLGDAPNATTKEIYHIFKITADDVASSHGAGFLPPHENVSSTYFKTAVTGSSRVAGQLSQSSLLKTYSNKYFKFVGSTTGDGSTFNSGIFTAAIIVDFATYNPWNFSQKDYAFFTLVSPGGFAPTLKDTYTKKLGFNGTASTSGIGELANIRYTTVVNRLNESTEQSISLFINPINDSGNILIRNTDSENYNHGEFNFKISANFNVQNLTPDTSLSRISSNSDLFCDKIIFSPSQGFTRNANNFTTGSLFLSGPSNSSNPFRRVSALVPNSTQEINSDAFNFSNLNTAENQASTATVPDGYVYKKVDLQFRFSPNTSIDYSYDQQTHFDGQDNETRFVDIFGRNVYIETFRINGGYNAVANAAVQDDEGGLSNAITGSDVAATSELSFTGLAWPQDPTVLLVAQSSLPGTTTAGSSFGPLFKASVTGVNNDGDETTYKWFAGQQGGNSGQSPTSLSLGNTSVNNFGHNTQPVTFSMQNAQEKFINGAEAVRARGFFKVSTAGTPVYEVNPRHNVAKLSSANNTGNFFSIAKPWNFFIHDTARLNDTRAVYECFIPVDLRTIGDTEISIIDISLVHEVGSLSADGSTVTLGALPDPTAASGTDALDARRMALIKAFKSSSEFQSNTTDSFTPADFVTQTGSAQFTENKYMWKTIAMGFGELNDNLYSADTSSMPGPKPYYVTGSATHNNNNGKVINSIQYGSTNPNSTGFEQTTTNAYGHPQNMSQGAYGPAPNQFMGTSFKTTSGNVKNAGRIAPNVSDSGKCSESSSTLYEQINNLNGDLPMIYFAVDRNYMTQQGVTKAFFYNRVRIRYIRQIKADQLQADGGIPGGVQTLRAANDQFVYEAFVMVKVEFNSVLGQIVVADLEDTVVEESGTINFGTIET